MSSQSSSSSGSPFYFGAVVLVAAFALAGSSCASVPDKNRPTSIIGPDFGIYKTSVDAYLHRRCGTLDCHGQAGRALRIYGFRGFRLYNQDAGLISGLQPTTAQEVLANYQSVISLEPEQMSRVIAAEAENPNSLMLLRKPLQLERHKGGPAMAQDDVGYNCIVSWLRAPVGGSLSAKSAKDCIDAQNLP